MGGGGPNRISRTENSKNPVADYQHKNYLAPTPPPGWSRPRPVDITPSADNAPSAKNFLTEVRKILDPPLTLGSTTCNTDVYQYMDVLQCLRVVSL